MKDYLKRQVLEVNMSHHVRFHHGQTVVDLNGDLTVFFNGGRPPSWICWARIGTTHGD